MARLTISCLLVTLALAAGCTPPGQSSCQSALPLAYEAKRQAEKLPYSPDQEDLVSRLDLLTRVLGGDQTPATGHVLGAAQWCDLFGPRTCDVTYSTRFADFDADGRPDGLIVWVSLKDQFGDPAKALGDFRVESFDYVPQAIDKRGEQRSNWFISVTTADDVRKYYDAFDRSYRFPLKFASPVAAQRLIVQATYYLPDGTGRKMFAQRVVKVEPPNRR